MHYNEVTPDKLRLRCDPDIFKFDCTSDIPSLREFIGQDRAIKALQFGLSVDHDGYNIFVSGLGGSGKTAIVKTYLQRQEEVRGEIHPDDWCYVYNFDDADRPSVLSVPQGKGKAFREGVSNVLDRLKEDLAKAFSSEEYQNRRKALVEEVQKEQQGMFREAEEEAKQQGFLFQMSPMGPVAVPTKNGEPLSQSEYMAMSEKDRAQLEERRMELMKKLQTMFEKAGDLQKQLGERLESSDRETAGFTVSHLFSGLERDFENVPQVRKFIDGLKKYTVENLEIFKQQDPQQQQQQMFMGMPANVLARGRDPYLPYQVNLFVDNSETKGAPVIEESNPMFTNMFGKTERRFLLGGYLSDHTMLKPGSLHLANQGYLLVSIRDILMNPGVWMALKRAVKSHKLGVEDAYETFGLIAPQGMKPEPMPIDVKVVLIGDPFLYQMLATYDDDFWELFKIKADVNPEIERNDDNMFAYAAFIAGCCEDCEIKHFDPSGVAKVIEYSSRHVEDQNKLSSRFAKIKELVQEAEHWAKSDNADLVSSSHVRRALDEQKFRHNLPDERIREMITRGTIMIDTEGSVVGQVNGLSIYALGDVAFGKPSRITCQTFLGRGGVINIERESQLSGRIHDKGVLILSGYLGWKYAQEHPLSLSASLCFEQSYTGVEGDSASSAELHALLSSISDIPLRQDIAVTGSVNQKGEIQPIGGVNYKIEGFYQVCKAKGLTGQQGVMIPWNNLQNLMLDEEIVEAVEQGRFHIYSVKTIDEGIELLTGIEAGRRRDDGTYPEGTVNNRVDSKLKEMAGKLRHFVSPDGGERREARVPSHAYEPEG